MQTFPMKISMKGRENMSQNGTINVALKIKRYFVRRTFLPCFTRSWYFSHADNLSFCHIGYSHRPMHFMIKFCNSKATFIHMKSNRILASKIKVLSSVFITMK